MQTSVNRSVETLALTGMRGRADRPLLDAYFGERARGLAPDEITLGQARRLKRNKWSVLPAGYEGATPSPDADAGLAGLVEQQVAQHQAWGEMLAPARTLLEQASATYILMKALSSPFALMSDIDFLVPDPVDIAAFAHELERAGFVLYRFRLLAHPLKVMAVYRGQSIKTPPAVDIYPDAMWIRKHVINGREVISRREKATVRNVGIWGPCPEDDLYLVATHAFSHGDITLGELDHGARLAASPAFDWDAVARNARTFGCVDGVFTYLGLLQMVCKHLGRGEVVPTSVLRDLARHKAGSALSAWLRTAEADMSFPVRVPLWLGTVHSAMHHVPAVAGKLALRELVMDTAVHGFTVGTHLMRRD